MKKLTNNKSGFTLIEIIVVLIIVGILAAIALPNLFSNVAKSKGAEAVTNMGAMRATMEACGQKNGQYYTGCGLDTTQVGLINNFNYGVAATCAASIAAPGTNVAIAAATATYCITADGHNAGDTAGTDYVSMAVASLGGQATCVGHGRYSGVC